MSFVKLTTLRTHYYIYSRLAKMYLVRSKTFIEELKTWSKIFKWADLSPIYSDILFGGRSCRSLPNMWSQVILFLLASITDLSLFVKFSW